MDTIPMSKLKYKINGHWYIMDFVDPSHAVKVATRLYKDGATEVKEIQYQIKVPKKGKVNECVKDLD